MDQHLAQTIMINRWEGVLTLALVSWIRRSPRTATNCGGRTHLHLELDYMTVPASRVAVVLSRRERIKLSCHAIVEAKFKLSSVMRRSLARDIFHNRMFEHEGVVDVHGVVKSLLRREAGETGGLERGLHGRKTAWAR